MTKIESELGFDALLAASEPADTVGAVLFHATYCQKCKLMMPKFARLGHRWSEKGKPGRLVLGTVNVNQVRVPNTRVPKTRNG